MTLSGAFIYTLRYIKDKTVPKWIFNMFIEETLKTMVANDDRKIKALDNLSRSLDENTKEIFKVSAKIDK